MSTHSRRTTLGSTIATALAVALLMLSGCGSSDSLHSYGESGSAGGDAKDAPAAANADQFSEAQQSSALRDGEMLNASDKAYQTGSAPDTTTPRAVISTGKVSLTTKEVASARDQVQKLVEEFDAEIAKEQSDTWARQDDGTTPLGWVSMTIRVPSDSFQELMDTLEGVATLRSSSQSAKDVTTQVIDTDVRVRAAEKSLKRVEQLLAQAKTLGEVIRIESELSQRQAELDSLKQTQAWLKEQTSLSTIKVSIDRDGVGSDEPGNGFVQAVKDSIRAMGDSAAAIVIFAGAVLPWLLVIALLLTPFLWWGRRRSARTKAAPTTTSNDRSADGD